jgi:redox-sensitive bicupin YhaK (pirin superfamily)
MQRIDAHRASIGGAMDVRRALPTAQRRTIGAWCFLDHFGPADVAATRGLRVGPHPHIGLQTVTWLLAGEVLHRDSLGTVQRIEPGALNLMTAGRGIAHSEESPQPHAPDLHGVQFWIALPEAARHGPPAFQHHPRVPVLAREGLRVTLLAGEWLGERSPAQVYTPLVGASIAAPAGARATLPLREDFEYGAIVTHGQAQLDGEPLAPGALLYLGRDRAQLALAAGSSDAGIVLVGGEPFAEPMLMWWNFVARTRDELTRACRDWNDARGWPGEVRGYDGPRLVAPLPPWSAGPAEVVQYP